MINHFRVPSISVVIVCKNEADDIRYCLESIKDITDDIVVYDNGSTDGTQEIVKNFGANLYEGGWEGFGKTKKIAVLLAQNDWVLNMDADEAIDDELKQSILNLEMNDNSIVYTIQFKNFFGKKQLRFGEWGKDKHVRLFNRKRVNWNEAEVHESPVLSKQLTERLLAGHILHYTVNNVAEYADKTLKYGLLNAEKYYRAGIRSSWVKIYMGPAFEFLKYFFQIRLSGWTGRIYLCKNDCLLYVFKI